MVPIRTAPAPSKGQDHGIKGELRVKTFTGDPLALADYGPLYAKDGRAFQITDIRPANTVVVVRFKGISDRNAAEALAGTELFVDRSMLPDDGEEDEFYHADLIDLPVTDAGGAEVGRVLAFHNFGGGDVMEIKRGQASIFVPFTVKMVPTVDVKGGRVVLSVEGVDAMIAANEAKTAGAAWRRPRRSPGIWPTCAIFARR